MSNIYIQEPPTNGKVLLDTSFGDVDIELWSKEAPKACRNFMQLCMEGYYDGTIFHRIVKGFIAQCGDPLGTGYGGDSIYGKSFKDEFHQRLRFNRRGLLGMANSGPDDNKSQFFFTLDAAPELDKKHTIFGKVGGKTIYNLIRLNDIEVDNNDRPLEPPKIYKTEILYNPFDDIEPRRRKKDLEEKVLEKEKKSKKRASKNFKLLSFGEEAEDDDGELTEISKNMQIKSSHDVLEDRKLSSDPAISKVESSVEKTISDDVRSKLTKKKESSKVEDDSPSESEENIAKRKRRDALKQEAKDIKRELAAKRKREDQPIETAEKALEEEEEVLMTNELMKQLKEEKKHFVTLKKEKSLLKKGGRREEETLALLAGFQDRLTATKEDTDQEIKEESDDRNGSWMSHTLKFESYEVKAKDANLRDEDTFDIYDPRNPINQRRREKSKHKRNKKETR